MSIRKANDSSRKNYSVQREGREDFKWATDETYDAELKCFTLIKT